MKALILTSFCMLFCLVVLGQQTIHFYSSGTAQSYSINESDSIYFDGTHTTLYFYNGGNTVQFAVADIDSITFSTDNSNNVYIDYQNATATVTNPLSGSGVTATVNGAEVTIVSTSTEQDINYICSGTSSSGLLKVYSDKRFNVLMNNLHLTNPTGPAVNVQSERKAVVHLLNGTNNSLTDGATYDAAVNSEDQKSTLFSEGKLLFYGGGSLTVNATGTDQHAIASDEEIEINEGSITIASSVKDGIHASSGFFLDGGTITITSQADGIDGGSGAVIIDCGTLTISSTSNDVKAITCDSIIVVNEGTIQLTVSGNKSKGLKSGQTMTINGGNITASTSGNAVLEALGSGYDPAYSSLLTSDGDLTINGGTMQLTTTGMGARAISGDANVTINGGTITISSSGNGTTFTNSTGATDAYHSACIKVDGNLVITDASITGTATGSGGKGIDCDGSIVIGDATHQPTIHLSATGSSITISAGGGGPGPGQNTGDYDEAKTIKADTDITVNNGTITLASANDGMKAGHAVVLNGGAVTITNAVEGIEGNFVTVAGGNHSVTCSDDGLNASAGSGGESDDGSVLAINGGYITINASGGDPLDSNGDISMTGGTVVVHGPQSSPEVGMDYNGTGLITGGFIVVSGTNSNMTQGFGNASSQRSLIVKSTQSIAANTLFHIEDAAGNEVVTFKPVRSYYSIVFSSSQIASGTTYKVYTGGSHSGTFTDGLYSGGTYTAGTLKQTFTVNNMVTTVNF